MKEDESDTVRDRVNLGIDSVRDSAWTVHERKRGVRDRVNLKCAVESITGPEWCITIC